jgi:hypothetical protein
MTLFMIALSGCGSTVIDPGPEPDVTPPAPALRRLTVQQYQNALVDLFGEDLVLPTSLEPDTTLEGLASLGAAVSATSPLGVERYEAAAFQVAEQVVDPERIGCQPAGNRDATCARQFVETIGRRVYRRPLTADETERLVTLLVDVGGEAGDFQEGARTALAAMLQSPHFVYRMEHTEGQLEAYEIANRLAWFLWNGPPDEALLEAAARGDLATRDGRLVQVERMEADPRFRRGVRDFFTELFHLELLPSLTKDPTVFPHASPELWASAREETLMGVEDLVVNRDGDYRELLTSRRTWIDNRLAALYGVEAPTLDGFGWTELPESTGRVGLLGHASILGLYAHPTSSSATRRGKFIRGTLLCQWIAPPPADVDTSIPEASNAPTLRDRLLVHQEDPTCASCHIPLDSVGLALENFDGTGRWRDEENHTPIDASGEVGDLSFQNAAEMAPAIAAQEDYTTCITERLYAYGVGHPIVAGEDEVLAWLHEDFVANGHSVRHLMTAIAVSDAFATGGRP